MAFEPLSENGKNADSTPLIKRLVWMFIYWTTGVLVISAIGLFIRFWIKV
jgi:hypothetical protein